MTGICQNGWPALESGSPLLHRWEIPARTGAISLTLRNGSAGFLLAYHLLWFAEAIEPLAGKVTDDWGVAFRNVRLGTDLSNHAGGLATDANALRHVLGRSGTFKPWQVRALHARLRWAAYGGCLRWGGDYHNRKDEMHTEIVRPMAACERAARRLMRTPRGRRLLEANPSQRAVILS